MTSIRKRQCASVDGSTSQSSQDPKPTHDSQAVYDSDATESESGSTPPVTSLVE
jgi:hypothetical protein